MLVEEIQWDITHLKKQNTIRFGHLERILCDFRFLHIKIECFLTPKGSKRSYCDLNRRRWSRKAIKYGIYNILLR